MESCGLNPDSVACFDLPLPLPGPLTRADFRKDPFDTISYLNTLTTRHETLEDLRNELRKLTRIINGEITELLNVEFTPFTRTLKNIHDSEAYFTQMQNRLSRVRDETHNVQLRLKSLHHEFRSCLSMYRTICQSIDAAEDLVYLDEALTYLHNDMAQHQSKPLNITTVTSWVSTLSHIDKIMHKRVDYAYTHEQSIRVQDCRTLLHRCLGQNIHKLRDNHCQQSDYLSYIDAYAKVFGVKNLLKCIKSTTLVDLINNDDDAINTT